MCIARLYLLVPAHMSGRTEARRAVAQTHSKFTTHWIMVRRVKEEEKCVLQEWGKLCGSGHVSGRVELGTQTVTVQVGRRGRGLEPALDT